MKVKELTQEQITAELKKTLKVRAIGDPSSWVGYYNHLRRRGGDVFILRPVVRSRPIKKGEKKREDILITAEAQFSSRWMELADAREGESAPKHFNEIGKGRKRYDVPGMTRKVGNDEGENYDPTPEITDSKTAAAIANAAKEANANGPALAPAENTPASKEGQGASEQIVI